MAEQKIKFEVGILGTVAWVSYGGYQIYKMYSSNCNHNAPCECVGVVAALITHYNGEEVPFTSVPNDLLFAALKQLQNVGAPIVDSLCNKKVSP